MKKLMLVMLLFGILISGCIFEDKYQDISKSEWKKDNEALTNCVVGMMSAENDCEAVVVNEVNECVVNSVSGVNANFDSAIGQGKLFEYRANCIEYVTQKHLNVTCSERIAARFQRCL